MLQSGKNELDHAIVNVSSYKFASAQAAQNQLQTVNVSLQAAGIEALTDAGAFLEAESTDLLTDQSTSWQIQAGRDDENLLVYFLWIQLDNHILETYVTVDDRNEQFGQAILQHVIRHVLAKEVSA